MQEYFLGKGLDVSKHPDYQISASHFYLMRSNLYRPSNFISLGSLDFLYCNDLNSSKFYKILLKEWFDLIKIGGFLVLDFTPNEILDYESLIKVLKTLYKDAFVVFNETFNAGIYRLVLKKIKNSERVLGFMDSWTFGIITGGSRPELVKSYVDCVRKQKVPNYEIIISGKWTEKLGEDVKIVDNTEAAEKGHITKMKNDLCQKALYENIVIVHDRVLLEEDWYKGMQLYGNNFDLLSCPQIDEEGNRSGDWLTVGGPMDVLYNVGTLEYDDWDDYVFSAASTVCIIKKSIWKKHTWNEDLYWNQGEDQELSIKLNKNGYISRFNPYSKTKVLKWRHGLFPVHKRNPYKLGDKQGMLVRRCMWFLLRNIYKFEPLKNFMESSFVKYIEKSRLKAFLINH